MESDSDHHHLDVSVVVPVYDEESAVEGLLGEIQDAVRTTGLSYEILFVDDGSRDNTLAVLKEAARRNPRLRVLQHSSNYGQSAAIVTGIGAARGDLVVTLDGDGQNDPADIPALINALGNADAACGVRARRQDTFVRRVSSRVANGFRNFITGDKVRDSGCGFRVLRRDALHDLPVFNGIHRFLPTLLRLQGLRVVEAPVGHRPRTTGRSKYGVGNRLLRGIVDCFAILWWRRRMVPARRLLAEHTPTEPSMKEVSSP